MSTIEDQRYTAEVAWQRGAAEPFVDQRYSRAHTLRFDGGIEVPGSASPQSVPLPLSVQAAVDPEEAFVAALAACHMLWFLSLAARTGWLVERYRDAADGQMTRNAQGRFWVSTVTLRPEVHCSGPNAPSHEELTALHHRAHEACYIANSVKTEVRCEPVRTRSVRD